jgi:hypothetical protein
LECAKSSVRIAGGNTAIFLYDADGCRSFNSINGISTQLLYDSMNSIQDLQNGPLGANMLTGLDIDEYFQRSYASSPSSILLTPS